MTTQINWNELQKLNDDDFFNHPAVVSALLQRPPYEADLRAAGGQFAGQTVLITGAAGSIGRSVALKMASMGPARLVLCDIDEAGLAGVKAAIARINPGVECVLESVDMCDRAAVDQAFRRNPPVIVLHAAANKYIDRAEADTAAAIRSNVDGSVNIADAAEKYGAQKCLLMSTDKACDPVSVLGASKRVGELYFQSMDALSETTRFAAIRAGNVLGSNGSALRLFRRQIGEKSAITITSPEMERYFLTLREITDSILLAFPDLDRTPPGANVIYTPHLEQSYLIVDIARRLCQMAGLKLGKDISIKTIGVRPGERIKELIISSDEQVISEHDHLVSLRSPAIVDAQRMRAEIVELCEAACGNEDAGLVAGREWRKSRLLTSGLALLRPPARRPRRTPAFNARR